ncbi:aldo/keto reductase [uncultured Albimonas sp.]|uniref:aldo/keto reductase n=1 Tax=uncultured Albimonas sp. TaxID=1331701 RepID=UPI0030EF93FC
MEKRRLGSTGLSIAPIVFGGNVFGWTIDEAESFRVLDAFVDHGFNAIDTADVYSRWFPGNEGGESETVIGRWLAARPGMREKVTIFTKVGSDMGQGKRDLSEDHILKAVEDSLVRLGIERIDLYFSHWPDPTVSHEETLGAYAKLLKAGKIASIGASNYDAELLGAALAASKAAGLPAYGALQNELNLYDRAGFDAELKAVCAQADVGVTTYFSLASGFLSGKYRSAADAEGRPRGARLEKYFDAKGMKVLAALDEVAGAQEARPAEVALAWLIATDGVSAPIASATSVAQVESFARAASMALSAEQMALLNAAGA